MKFPRSTEKFVLQEDGTVYVRTGVQTNCGGIAAINVKITPAATKSISFKISECEGEHEDSYGFKVPASAVPAEFREAVFEGARIAFDETNPEMGIDFELLSALVHMVDAREIQFKKAGYYAVLCWFESEHSI